MRQRLSLRCSRIIDSPLLNWSLRAFTEESKNNMQKIEESKKIYSKNRQGQEQQNNKSNHNNRSFQKSKGSLYSVGQFSISINSRTALNFKPFDTAFLSGTVCVLLGC